MASHQTGTGGAGNLFFRRVRADVLQSTGSRQEPATYESLPAERFVFRPQTGPRPSQAPGPMAALPPVQATPILSRKVLLEACDKAASAPYDADRNTMFPGTMSDLNRAVGPCREAVAATPGERRHAFQLARALWDEGASAEARQMYERAAGMGSAAAMHDLGQFLSGSSDEKERSVGRAWYERSAEAGNAKSMLEMVRLNADGHKKSPDLAKARSWLERVPSAIVFADTVTMDEFAGYYASSRVVPTNYDVARSWYQKSTKFGSVWAMWHLGRMYEDGHGVKKDYKTARNYYEKAAAKGHESSMIDAGYMSERGLGGPKDMAAARKWYDAAIALSNRDSVKNSLSLRIPLMANWKSSILPP